MQQFTADDAKQILQAGQRRCAFNINGYFYYSEGGRSYRFEQHHSQKALEALLLSEEQALTQQELQQMMEELVVKQIQYDWFTDVSNDSLFEQLVFIPKLNIFFF